MVKCRSCGRPVDGAELCYECEKIEQTKSELPSEVTEEEEEKPLELTSDSIIEVGQAPTADSPVKDLMDAVKRGSFKVVNTFLSEGADINMKSSKGWTPLHEAAKEGNLEMVRLLIDKGAEINMTNERGWTPVHRAANYGHLNVVEFLFRKGADLNIKDNDGFSSLAYALRNKNLGIASFLIENGINPNGSIDEKNRPALVYSLKNSMWGIAELLIGRGADPNSKDGNEPVLIFVMKNDRYDIAKMLLLSGADPSSSDNNETALIIAFRTDHFEFAKLLIEKGADVNCRDSRKMTPLHYAAVNGDIQLVQMIVSKKANLLAADVEGNLPLHKSASKEISAFLREKMFPYKMFYSFNVFILAFLLTSVTIPLIFSYIFSGLLFVITMMVGEWPKKTSLRLYLLEIFAVYLLATNIMGIHPDSFDYPWVFLIIPAAFFIILNLVFRPVFLYAGAVRVDGARPGFAIFMKEYFLSKISYSPLTLLRALNVVAIAIIFLLSIIYNYDHLKKSDNYLFSYIIRSVPSMPEGVVIVKPGTGKPNVMNVYSVSKNIDIGSSKTGQVDYDKAISLYAEKNFSAALVSLDKAAADRTITDKAVVTKLEMNRFKSLWDKLSRDKSGKLPADRRALMINRMIKYDKNISGGRLESEILLLKHIQ